VASALRSRPRGRKGIGRPGVRQPALPSHYIHPPNGDELGPLISPPQDVVQVIPSRPNHHHPRRSWEEVAIQRRCARPQRRCARRSGFRPRGPLHRTRHRTSLIPAKAHQWLRPSSAWLHADCMLHRARCAPRASTPPTRTQKTRTTPEDAGRLLCWYIDMPNTWRMLVSVDHVRYVLYLLLVQKACSLSRRALEVLDVHRNAPWCMPRLISARCNLTRQVLMWQPKTRQALTWQPNKAGPYVAT